MRTARTLLCVALLSCSGSPPQETHAPRPPASPSAATAGPEAQAAPEPPAEALRAGRLAPRDGQPLELAAEARYETRGVEFLRVAMPPLQVSEQVTITEVGGVWVHVESSPAALSFVAADGRGTPSLFVRRPVSAEPATGFVYTPALPSRFAGATVVGHRFPLTVRVRPGARSDARLEAETYAALASQLDPEPTAFSMFAASRLRDRVPVDEGAAGC